MLTLKTLVLMAVVLLPLPAQKAELIKGKPTPTQFRSTPWVLGAETGARWQGLLPQVNAPAVRTKAYPGQRLTIAVGAQGKDREALLKGATYTFTVHFGGATTTFKDLRPNQIRPIKAEGADFVSFIAKEIKLPAAELDQMLSVVSLALFDLEWVVPADTKGGLATFSVTASGPARTSPGFQESTVDIWSYDRVAQEGNFKDLQAAGDWMMSYYQQPSPSRLLHALRVAGNEPRTYQPQMITFYSDVLKADPGAAADLLTRLSAEPIPTRFFGYYLLRVAGYDLTGALASLPQEQREGFDKCVEGFAALPDPYDLAPDQADYMKIPNHMDMLWSHFLVTGSQEPVKAIASVLQWRAEGKAFVDLRKSGKKPEALTLEIVRAISYMASGWSLGSFVRNHPLVADYVALWKMDMTTSQVVKEELGTLLTNEAFKGK